MVVPNSGLERPVIFKRIQLGGILHVIRLRYRAERAGEKTQKLPHCCVVSNRGGTGKSRHVGAADRRRRDDGLRGIAAQSARHGSSPNTCILRPRALPSRFTTHFEGVFALRPTESVAECPHFGYVLITAGGAATQWLRALEIDVVVLAGEVLPQADPNRNSADIWIECLGGLAGARIVEGVKGVS